jgi:hypothetical protein
MGQTRGQACLLASAREGGLDTRSRLPNRAGRGAALSIFYCFQGEGSEVEGQEGGQQQFVGRIFFNKQGGGSSFVSLTQVSRSHISRFRFHGHKFHSHKGFIRKPNEFDAFAFVPSRHVKAGIAKNCFDRPLLMNSMRLPSCLPGTSRQDIAKNCKTNDTLNDDARSGLGKILGNGSISPGVGGNLSAVAPPASWAKFIRSIPPGLGADFPFLWDRS